MAGAHGHDHVTVAEEEYLQTLYWLYEAGLPKVGPSTAAIISTVEPLVSVAMAMLWFGERLGVVQILGGALVLAAVVLLAVKVRGRVPAAESAGAAAAGPLARELARG